MSGGHERLADMNLGRIVVAALMLDEAHEVVGLHLPRRQAEDALVAGGGLGEAALLVQLHALPQQAGEHVGSGRQALLRGLLGLLSFVGAIHGRGRPCWAHQVAHMLRKAASR